MSVDAAIDSVLAAQNAATRTQIDVALLAKGQDAAKAQGDAVVQMLNAAAQIGKAIGKGEILDALA
ncbi:MAG: hypothetical protein CMJ58_07045 [Planctomycetaceae bacterium]|nr:hypothetical protein [Planctomycetaceae bacterium]